MFWTVSYKAHQLRLLYHKLTDKSGTSEKPFIYQPMLLSSSCGGPTNQYTVFATELKSSQPFELYQPALPLTDDLTGFLIHLIDSPDEVAYQFGETVKTMKRGLLIMQANQPYSVKISSGYQGLWCIAHFSGKWCDQLFRFGQTTLPEELPLTSRLKHYSQELYNAEKTSVPLAKLNRTTQLNQLFYHLIIELTELNKRQPDELLVRHTKQFLQDQISQKFPSLQSLADIANLSVSSLKRKFYLSEGLSPEQFFIDQKMETAVRQLEEKLSIKEIALNVGYANSSNFINAFKRKYGVSPLKFTRENQLVTKP